RGLPCADAAPEMHNPAPGGVRVATSQRALHWNTIGSPLDAGTSIFPTGTAPFRPTFRAGGSMPAQPSAGAQSLGKHASSEHAPRGDEAAPVRGFNLPHDHRAIEDGTCP